MITVLALLLSRKLKGSRYKNSLDKNLNQCVKREFDLFSNAQNNVSNKLRLSTFAIHKLAHFCAEYY